MIRLAFTIIMIVVLYLLFALYLTAVDIYKINMRGKALSERKRTLEELAIMSGYSESGWHRYEEYQQFMQRYGDIVNMYHYLRTHPTPATLNLFIQSLIMVPIVLYTGIKERAIMYKVKYQTKQKRED